jgi:hypothetical protein
MVAMVWTEIPFGHNAEHSPSFAMAQNPSATLRPNLTITRGWR